MLEKPAIDDDLIIACLSHSYGQAITDLTFLPLGADTNTAVYRASTAGRNWFVKLRSGDFNESGVTVPDFLSNLGISSIIPPVRSVAGQLWAVVEGCRLILYPFVEGRDGYEVELSARHWRELGAALRRIHAAELPAAVASGIRREEFSPRWRGRLREFLNPAATQTYADPVAAELAAFLIQQRGELLDLIDHAERHAAALSGRPYNFVLCHSDLHAGNVLIDADGALYIVDWDQPIFAPRERDLMYPGGAQGFSGRSAAEEERLLFLGYGPVEVDPAAVAYYRFERIIEDLALYCEQLLLSDEGGADRPQALRYVKSNFRPGGTIERAYTAQNAVATGQTPGPDVGRDFA